MSALLLAAGMLLASEAFGQEQTGTGRGTEEDRPELEVGARLHTLWTLTDQMGKPDNDFRVRMARVNLEWRQDKLLEAALEFDVGGYLGEEDAGATMRDCYVRLQPYRWLRLQGGQFKKPFSYLELRSYRRLETVYRGLGNDWIVDELGYGGRDVGLMLDGRLVKSMKLDYYLGVFNGTGANTKENDPNGSKDLSGRLEMRAGESLSFGVNGTLRFFDRAVDEDLPEYTWAAAADAVLEQGALRLVVEGLYGKQFELEGRPGTWAGVGMVAYKAELSEGLWLQPVLKLESVSPDVSYGESRAFVTSVGANLFVGEYTRLMMHGERLTGKNLPVGWTEYSRLLVQLAFDL